MDAVLLSNCLRFCPRNGHNLDNLLNGVDRINATQLDFPSAFAPGVHLAARESPFDYMARCASSR